MFNVKPTTIFAPKSSFQLTHLLDTLPEALLVIDDNEMILYANVAAAASVEMTTNELRGHTFWRSAPHLVSPALYQAVRKTRQTQEPTDVEYRSPVTQAWLHVHLAPTVEGLMVQFHEKREPTPSQEAFFQNAYLAADVVENLYAGVGFLTPEGILLEINKAPLEDAQIQLEEVIGHPFAETPWWSFYPVSQQQLRAAIARASRGETVRFETLVHPREGMDLHLEAVIIPHRDADHQVEYLVYVGTDITERKRAEGEIQALIDEQKRTEEALRQSQQRIRVLIDSNLIGIVSSEGEEKVTEANEAFLHMTGYSQEEVRNGMLTRERITPPDQAALFERSCQELAERGQCTPFETELLCKDGSRLPILVGGVLLQDRPRQIISFVLDNSARKELEQRKDAFISMASHELRTPLTALKLQTQLLQRQLAQQGMQNSVLSLSRMEAQINTITRLVEELLDISKIQAGRLEYVRERVELDILLQEITDSMQHTHPSHTIVMRGATQSSLIGDRDRLAQVFTNLLSNAIKYSPDAQTVELALDASEEAVTIRVHDHGLGIPQEQRDKIFERFYRASGPKQKAIPGLGMGLYIVAEIVKNHGGTISVESEVGKGSIFTVTLPKEEGGLTRETTPRASSEMVMAAEGPELRNLSTAAALYYETWRKR